MILVTGGTGLVGIHLLMELSNLPKQKITAIYRSEESLSHASKVFHSYNPYQNIATNWDKISWTKADIIDVPSLVSVFNNYTFSQVYHCAGYVTFQSNTFNTLKKVNIEGTANIVNLSIDYGVDKLCYVSSIATLNLKPDQTIIDESSEWNSEQNNSGYAISKYGGEMEVWRGSEEGLSVIIVHPAVIIGQGFTTGSSDIFTKAKKGIPFFTDGTTGYVSAKDVSKAILQLMTSSIKNDRFVLASENLSHKKVITLIANATNKKKPKYKVSKMAVTIFTKLEAVVFFISGYTPTIPVDMISSLFSKTKYTSRKIEKALPFSFQPMEKHIKEVAKSFMRDNLK